MTNETRGVMWDNPEHSSPERKRVTTPNRNGSGRLGFVIPALIGMACGVVGALLIMRYPHTTKKASLQAACLAEIQVILTAVRGAAKDAFNAWEQKRGLADHQFYHPRAIFEGNVAHLADLRDKPLVHDIAFLYAELEQAREEGRRLEAHASDADAMFRYAHHLWSALGLSMALIERLSGEPPKVTLAKTQRARLFNALALEVDTEFLAAAADKFLEVLLPEESLPTKKTP